MRYLHKNQASEYKYCKEKYNEPTHCLDLNLTMWPGTTPSILTYRMEAHDQ